jgi:hypothetical protein
MQRRPMREAIAQFGRTERAHVPRAKLYYVPRQRMASAEERQGVWE